MCAAVGKGNVAGFFFGETVLKVERSRPIGLDRCTAREQGVQADALGRTYSPEH
jgi:hypothetical protein